jgi:hypothetical protein
MTKQIFTTDNTEGYSAADLAELNRDFAISMSTCIIRDEDTLRSYEKHVAEEVLARFDRRRVA